MTEIIKTKTKTKNFRVSWLGREKNKRETRHNSSGRMCVCGVCARARAPFPFWLREERLPLRTGNILRPRDPGDPRWVSITLSSHGGCLSLSHPRRRRSAKLSDWSLWPLPLAGPPHSLRSRSQARVPFWVTFREVLLSSKGRNDEM